jgi:hypothetical protein
MVHPVFVNEECSLEVDPMPHLYYSFQNFQVKSSLLVNPTKFWYKLGSPKSQTETK